jgi:hypothetical protein
MGMKAIGLGAAMALVLLIGGVGSAGAVGLGGICGPILNGACDPGLFCEHKAGTCSLIGGTGKCVRIPAVCGRYIRPVCGCNGVTYNNDCERIKAGAQKAHNGRCK